MKIAALAVLATAALAGCASDVTARTIAITGRLESFEQNAEWSDFSDGSYQSHHASMFRILAPRSLCGRTLAVYQTDLPTVDSPWRSVGRTFHLAVEKPRIDALSARRSSNVFYGSHGVTVLGPAEEPVPECSSRPPNNPSKPRPRRRAA